MGFGIPLRNSAGLGVGGLASIRGSLTSSSPPPPLTPAINLDFTTGSLDSRVTFSRSSTATYFDAAGNMQTAAINQARFDYNPSTLANLGILLESSSTNLILGSDAPVSQNITISGFQAIVLSFYGTGTIVYSGVASGTLVGIGAFPSRAKASFLSSGAGTLTLTITGLVQFAQLEVNASSPSSYIKTTAAQVTRAEDAASIDGVNFSSWFASGSGTFFAEYETRVLGFGAASGSSPFCAYDATVASVISFNLSNGAGNAICYVSNVDQGVPSVSGSYSIGTFYRQALSYNTNAAQLSVNGVNAAIDTTFSIPSSLIGLTIGRGNKTLAQLNGHVKRFKWYATSVSSTQLQALTA